MEVVERKKQKVTFEPAQRCPGYDSECKNVYDHFVIGMKNKQQPN